MVTERLALITRPREDSEGIAQALAARGFALLREPLLEILPRREEVVSLEGVQAILATSANGLRALAARIGDRALPVWAVGNATAHCARDLGFGQVSSAAGEVSSLAELVAASLNPQAGALLHPAGTHLAGDLAGTLGRHGFDVRRAVLYEARPMSVITPTLEAALKTAALRLAVFFSPRTAETFVNLVERANLQTTCRTVTAYGLSAAVAAKLSALPWRSVEQAATPDQASLLTAIDRAEAMP